MTEQIRMIEFADWEKTDSQRIRQVAAAHGVVLSLIEAHFLWTRLSDDWCAGWLYLPQDDDRLWQQVEPYITFLQGEGWL